MVERLCHILIEMLVFWVENGAFSTVQVHQKSIN